MQSLWKIDDSRLRLPPLGSYPPLSSWLGSDLLLSAPLLSSPLCTSRLLSDPLVSSLLLLAPLLSTPLFSAPLFSAPLRSTPLHSAPLRSALLRSSLLWGEENIRSVGFSTVCTYTKKLTTSNTSLLLPRQMNLVVGNFLINNYARIQFYLYGCHSTLNFVLFCNNFW